MRRHPLLLVFPAVTAVVIACTGEDPASTADTGGTDGGTTATGSDASDKPAPTPAPDEKDAGQVTTPGGDPDEEADGGAVPVVDAGVDAGVCGPASGNGPTLKSACSSNLVVSIGGAIAEGTYDLLNLSVQGNPTFCGSYVAQDYAGRLDIAQEGGKLLLRERVQRVGGLQKPGNVGKTFEAVANGTNLGVTQLCGPQVTAKSWGYGVGTVDGKTTLTYTHDQGSATVRYRWVKR